MIRSWIKTGAAGVLSRTGMDRAVGTLAGSNHQAVVIGYHRVVEDFASAARTSIPSMLVSRQMLERHLDWIGRRFRFVSLDELGARLDGTDTSIAPIAAITFDDGYRDFYDHAFPVLKRKGIPAAVFIVTGLVGTTEIQVHDKLYLLLARRAARFAGLENFEHLLRDLGVPVQSVGGAGTYEVTRTLIEMLSQEELRRVLAVLESESPIPESTWKPFYSMTWEMLASACRGGVTVGSHTRTHVLITNESAARTAAELRESRHEIEARLGTEARHFAYPSGQFNTRAVKAVADAGYRFAYTVCSHRDPAFPRLTVSRTLLWQNSCGDYRGRFSGSILSCQIHRAFEAVSGCRQRHRGGGERTYG